MYVSCRRYQVVYTALTTYIWR